MRTAKVLALALLSTSTLALSSPGLRGVAKKPTRVRAQREHRRWPRRRSRGHTRGPTPLQWRRAPDLVPPEYPAANPLHPLG